MLLCSNTIIYSRQLLIVFVLSYICPSSFPCSIFFLLLIKQFLLLFLFLCFQSFRIFLFLQCLCTCLFYICLLCLYKLFARGIVMCLIGCQLSLFFLCYCLFICNPIFLLCHSLLYFTLRQICLGLFSFFLLNIISLSRCI